VTAVTTGRVSTGVTTDGATTLTLVDVCHTQHTPAHSITTTPSGAF